jgi:hypothetical protein
MYLQGDALDGNHHHQPGFQSGRRQGEEGRVPRPGLHHVLLTIEDYRTLVGERQADIVELLALEPPIETFEPERLDGEYYRPADFS